MYVQHPYKYEGKYYAKIDGVFYEISKEVAMAMFAEYRNEIYRSRKWAPESEEDDQMEDFQDLENKQEKEEPADQKDKKWKRKTKRCEILDCAFSANSDGLSIADMADDTQMSMPKNLAIYATVPKYKSAKREIWTAETLMHALEVCEDERLKLALNLAFSCSMRMGEMLGLTWDCVDISDEAIEEGRAFIYIDKEVQRVDKAAIQELHGKDVILVFPEESRKSIIFHRLCFTAFAIQVSLIS